MAARRRCMRPSKKATCSRSVRPAALLAAPATGTHPYVCGPKGFMDTVLCTARKVRQMLQQMRPVVACRILRVVPIFVDGLHREAARAQAVEQHFVGAGGEAVGVGKYDQINLSSGVRIFLSGLARLPSTISGTLVCSPFHIGSSMLSNTWRSFWPQLLCIILK